MCYHLEVNRVPKVLALAPAERTLRLLGGRWKLTILSHVLDVPRGFVELERLVPGISEKVLTEQLGELEAQGLLMRQAHPGSPPRIEYVATELGRRSRSLMQGLFTRGAKHAVVEVGSRAH